MRYKLTHSFWMNITLADLSFPEELSILSRMATCEDYRGRTKCPSLLLKTISLDGKDA
jgi:hypothetical protein